MADNSDIAGKIYDTIQRKQLDPMEEVIIRPVDFIDISKEEFVKALQKDVGDMVKRSSNANSIDIADVYINILARTENMSIDKIKGMLVGNRIMFPQNIIQESIKEAVVGKTTIRDDTFGPNKSRLKVDTDSQKSTLDEMLSNNLLVKDAMKNYNSLSDSDKAKARRIVGDEVYGDGMGAVAARCWNTDTEPSKFYQMGSNDDRKNADKINHEYEEAYSELFQMLGIKSDAVKSSSDFMEITLLFRKIMLSSSDKIVEELNEDKALLEKLGIKDIEKFVQQFAGKKISEKIKGSKLDEIINLNTLRIENNYQMLKELLTSIIGEEYARQINYNDARKIFLTTIDFETGEINPILATECMSNYVEEHNFIKFNEKSFFDGINQNKNILIQRNDRTEELGESDTSIPVKTENNVDTSAAKENNGGADIAFAPFDVSMEKNLAMQDMLFAAFSNAHKEEVKSQNKFFQNMMNPPSVPQPVNDNNQKPLTNADGDMLMEDRGVEMDASMVDKSNGRGTTKEDGEKLDLKEVVVNLTIPLHVVCQKTVKQVEENGITTARIASLVPPELARVAPDGNEIPNIKDNDLDQDI